jgi:hypothetical protein
MFGSSLVQVSKIMKIKDEISFKLIISEHRYACVHRYFLFLLIFYKLHVSFVTPNQRAKEFKRNGATSVSVPRKRTPWNPHSWTQNIFVCIYINFKLSFYKIILPIKPFVSYFPHIDSLWFDQPFQRIRNSTRSDPFHRNTNPAIRTARKCVIRFYHDSNIRDTLIVLKRKKKKKTNVTQVRKLLYLRRIR